MTAEKPSDVLKDVIAFVDVWSSSRTENYAKPFIEQLLEMGAEVSKTFDKHVTHVVFKNGHQSTWNKAKKTGVKLVSVLWVARCKECREHIDEDLCPALNEGSHNNPALSKRTHRCMQPRDIPEQTVENNKSMKRKLDRMMKSLEVSSPSSPDVSPFLIDEEHGIVYSPSSRRARDMAQRLKVMREKRESLSRTDSHEEDDSSDLDTSFSDFHSSSVGRGGLEGRHSHNKRALDSGVTRSIVGIDQTVPESLTGTEKMTLVNYKDKRKTVEHPSLQGLHGEGKRRKLQKLSDSSARSSVYEHQMSLESPHVDLFRGEGAISPSAAGLDRTQRGLSSSSKCEQAEKVTVQCSRDPRLRGEGKSRSTVKMTRILDTESSDPCGPMKSPEARSLPRDRRRSVSLPSPASNTFIVKAAVGVQGQDRRPKKPASLLKAFRRRNGAFLPCHVTDSPELPRVPTSDDDEAFENYFSPVNHAENGGMGRALSLSRSSEPIPFPPMEEVHKLQKRKRGRSEGGSPGGARGRRRMSLSSGN